MYKIVFNGCVQRDGLMDFVFVFWIPPQSGQVADICLNRPPIADSDQFFPTRCLTDVCLFVKPAGIFPSLVFCTTPRRFNIVGDARRAPTFELELLKRWRPLEGWILQASANDLERHSRLL